MPSPPYQSFPVKQGFENETEIVLARLALPSVPIVMHRIFSRSVPHTHAYSLLDGYRAPRSTADSARRPWPSGEHSSGEIDSTYAPTVASIAGGLLVCFYLIDLIFQYQNSFTITQSLLHVFPITWLLLFHPAHANLELKACPHAPVNIC